MGTVKYTGPVASFHCPTNAEIRSLKVHFSPKQEGTGEPSPENVRPIVGWDGVEVYINDSTTDYEFGVLGKNKFDYTNSDNWRYANTTTNRLKTKPTNVNISIDNNVVTLDRNAERWGYSFILGNLVKGVSYCLSGNFTNIDGKAYIAKLDSETIQDDYTCTRLFTLTFIDNQVTFIPTTNGVYELLLWSSGTNSISVSNLQLELGSTATTYEPYDPKHTVYGGWVDLISGEVCEEWEYGDMGDLNWDGASSASSTYAKPVSYLNAYGEKDMPLLLTDSSLVVTLPHFNQLIGSSGYYATVNSLGRFYFMSPDINEMSSTQIKEWMQGKKYCVYKTPSIYYLAPTELQTFLGHNNVWSNADYVEVEYDLYETQTVLQRKAFIMANQPHIVKPAAAGLQSFKTDMIAPLKECKVHFSPVQSGTGDPSPTNIRPISGWTGLTMTRNGKNFALAATGTEMVEKLPIINSGRQQTLSSNFPKDQDFVLSATWTKAWPTLANRRLYLNGNKTSGMFIGPPQDEATKKEVNNKPNASTGILSISHNNLGLTSEEIDGSEYAASLVDIQLELGSTATTYEPYNGQTIILDWTTEAGTVYGGYINLLTGEIWETYHGINLTSLGDNRGLSINTNGNTHISWFLVNHLNAPNATGYVPYSTDGYCSHFPFIVNNYYLGPKCQVNNNTMDINFEGELTAEQVDAWIKSHAPIQIVYPVQTPYIVGTIDPQTLKTLRGINNIWSSANGDIDLSYWTH